MMQLLPRRFRRNVVLGADIGTDGARFVLISRRGQQLKLEEAFEIPLTEMQGFVDFDTVLDRVAPALQQRGLRHVPLATLPPWNAERLWIEEMPEMTAERFAKAAEWFFQRSDSDGLQNPVNQAIAQPLRESNEGRPVLDAIMSSLDEVMIQGLRELAARLELEWQWLIPHPLAFLRLLPGHAEAPRAMLLLDIGAGQTRMYAFADGAVRLARKLPPSSNQLLKDLCAQFELSWTQGAELVQAHSGVGPLAQHDPDGLIARSAGFLKRSFAQLAKSLSDEISRSSAYVSARFGVEIEGVLLTGGLSGAPLLREELRSAMTLPLLELSPFAGLQRSPRLAVEDPQRYTLAVGAALSALAASRESDLYVPRLSAGPRAKQAQHQGISPSLRRALIGAGSLAFLTAVGLAESQMYRAERRQEFALQRMELRLNELEDEAQELASLQNLRSVEEQIATLHAIYAARRLQRPLLVRVANLLPGELWLEGIRLHQPPQARDGSGRAENLEPVDEAELIVRGRTSRIEAVGQLVLALEQERVFRTLAQVDLAESPDGDGIEFTLRGAPSHRPNLPANPIQDVAR